MSHSAPVGLSCCFLALRVFLDFQSAPAGSAAAARMRRSRAAPCGCLQKWRYPKSRASLYPHAPCKLLARGVLRMVMQVHFSTEHLAPGERVRPGATISRSRSHSITPGEIPDSGAFRAEASGSIAGEFALLDIKSGLERVQRTAADIAKDKTEAIFVRRFRVPVIWRAAPRSTPVDLSHEPGDFCVSSSEWQFDAESTRPGLVRHADHPTGRALTASNRGPIAAPFSAARRLAARLATRRSHRCG